MTNEKSHTLSLSEASVIRNSIDNLIPRPPGMGQSTPASPFKIKFKAMRRLASNRNRLHALVEPAETIIQTAVEEARRDLKEGEPIPAEKVRELNLRQKELFDDRVEVVFEQIDEADLAEIDDLRVMGFLIAENGRIVSNGT